SGHLIFLNYSTTGDGILAALQMLKIMQEKQRPASELASILELFPQELINVPVQEKKPFEQVPQIKECVEFTERSLNGKGRVFLRYSGTESLARVMVEGQNPDQVQFLAQDLAEVLRQNLC
ncbi:MAG: phosphoglucosamine mutase, partial [Desulfohalobiaceae bacterium]